MRFCTTDALGGARVLDGIAGVHFRTRAITVARG